MLRGVLTLTGCRNLCELDVDNGMILLLTGEIKLFGML